MTKRTPTENLKLRIIDLEQRNEELQKQLSAANYQNGRLSACLLQIRAWLRGHGDDVKESQFLSALRSILEESE